MPRFKKCVSGICLGNLTWVLLIGFACLVLYFVHQLHDLGKQIQKPTSRIIPTPTVRIIPTTRIIPDAGRCGGGGDPLSNPYVPPIRCDLGGSQGIPINIPTQGYNHQYAQVGILTRNKGGDILPLMGRRVNTSRDKWQYYTVAGGGAGGNLQTKIPLTVKGKSGSSEYGCDEISNQDHIFVDPYQDVFIATIYESGLFSYIPF
jgi:hypothetical protein